MPPFLPATLLIQRMRRAPDQSSVHAPDHPPPNRPMCPPTTPQHDGTTSSEYYEGHANWAPIMGVRTTAAARSLWQTPSAAAALPSVPTAHWPARDAWGCDPPTLSPTGPLIILPSHRPATTRTSPSSPRANVSDVRLLYRAALAACSRPALPACALRAAVAQFGWPIRSRQQASGGCEGVQLAHPAPAPFQRTPPATPPPPS